MSGSYASRVEISRSALFSNVDVFRRLLRESGTELAAVIKANAYGHGMKEVARLMVEAGVDWLAVDALDEAETLRGEGIDLPLLLLGAVPLEMLDRVVELRLRPTVFNLEMLQALEKAASGTSHRVPLHLKLETGTCRQGFTAEQLEDAAAFIRQSGHLEVEGVSTHFANIEDTTDHTFAHRQLDVYTKMLARLNESGISPRIRHVACSAATLLFPQTYLDMARVGIGLYGLWPSRETLVSLKNGVAKAIELKPVLTWKTRLVQIKEMPAGAFIGYGCTYRTTRHSRLAVLPVGYYDGYDRGLSNVGHVLVKGQRAPVRGRVFMNMTVVDVTDIPEAALDDEVVLIGRQGDEGIPVELIASVCGTIHYEVVSRIHPAIPRVVVA